MFAVKLLLGLKFAAIPFVHNLKWGEVIVKENNKITIFKDVKLSPSGAKEWDWNKTGTRHNPGIQIADVEEIFNEADIFILSKGMQNVLQVKQETDEYLKKLGKTVYILQSEEAVKLYNELVSQNKKVAALIHSTC